MGTVHLELPAELVQAADLNTANPSQEAAKLLALELFREEKVSLGRAAELCQTPLEAFLDFAAEHGVPHYATQQRKSKTNDAPSMSLERDSRLGRFSAHYARQDRCVGIATETLRFSHDPDDGV